ncbi:hydrogenase maturation protease [bacterium]|nr:hydrogenase maturation protease [bacterium]
MTTLVIGCGNPLRGDDAVGVNVVQRLQAHALPDGVRCVDAGTSGLEVVLLIQDADRVILVMAWLRTLSRGGDACHHRAGGRTPTCSLRFPRACHVPCDSWADRISPRRPRAADGPRQLWRCR